MSEPAETHIVALSGGKDSTALALRLAEVAPRPYLYLCTPTGDELPEMLAHWERLECLLGRPLTRITNRTLNEWIDHFDALPNWRQRWCTRLLKIEPCLAFMKSVPNPILYVGLRADEEEREGIYSADVQTRFPLREWGWGLAEVQRYLRERRVKIPKRTDCARCYGQRLHEWSSLWRDHPELYRSAEEQEERIWATFRSPGRDSKPARLSALRVLFEGGLRVPGDGSQLGLFDRLEDDENTADQGPCRVCRL